MKKIYKLFVSLMISTFAYSQGAIQSVIPAAALPGQSVEMVIKGVNTEFQIGAVTVNMGADVIVQQVTVNNSFTLVLTVQILNSAASGSRDLLITSSGQSIEMFNAFEILDGGANNVTAILEINPVQVLYASDFDPDNLANAPLLFRVTVLNDQQTRDLKTFFYLIHNTDGLMLTAIKELPDVQPGAVSTFNNREFDEFELTVENAGILENINATGVLPPGVYTYRIEVKQGNAVLTSAEGTNVLLNQDGDLVIISPGSAFESGLPPENQLATQPLFQWISSGNFFDLFLYEVPNEQSSAQEIIQSMPVYREFSIGGNSFIYPLSAEPLEKGVTYAWQLRAYYNNPGGNRYFDSPLYWFQFGDENASNVTVGTIEINPNFLELKTTLTKQFVAEVVDFEGNVLNLDLIWKVLPNDKFGSIDKNGLFTAGQYPMIGAVQVSYGEYSTHCVVELKVSGSSFLNSLFGHGTYKVRKEE